MFEVALDLIEALHDLTSDMILPEDATGEPVPTPSPYPLLPTPEESKAAQDAVPEPAATKRSSPEATAAEATN